MKYKSEALKVIHMGAKDKYKAGIISEARMREYDEMCLKNIKINIASPEEVEMINERMKDYETDPSSFVPL